MKRLFVLFCLFAGPAYAANAPIFTQTSLSGPILVWNGSAFITLLSKLNALQAPAVTPVNGNCASWNNNNLVDAGAPCGTVTSGTSGQLAYYSSSGTVVVGLNLGGGLAVASGALTPVQQKYAFTGDGSTMTFSVSPTPVTVARYVVAIGGVVQDASVCSLSTTQLTCSAPPPSGVGIQLIDGP